MTAKTFDVIIVGAGPAGCAAAYMLSGHGLSIAVVEKSSEFINNLDDKVAIAKPVDNLTTWSVQIGNFAQRMNAHKAAIRARRMADNVLGMTPANLTLVTRGEMPLWRVRFNDLDESQARSACAALFAEGNPCIALQIKTIKG